MVGYGDEDSHFVMELTYNYGIGEYRLGNDFQGITIESKSAIENARQHKWPIDNVSGDLFVVEAPGGYKFFLQNNETASGDPVKKVSLGVSNLQKSLDYWSKLCGMTLVEKTDQTATLGYDRDNQCHLELVGVDGKIDHGTAFGRVAIACPKEQLPEIESQMKAAGETIVTPFVSLDTPGKATVQVVIVADPDGHEICFVGDEAFRELSQVDPQADESLNKAIEADKSDEWFAKHKRQKEVAS